MGCDMRTDNFTVTNPPILFRLCLCIIGFFGILALVYTVFSPPPHIAMYVCLTLFVFIPGMFVALWTKMFRIEVSGTQICVRKCLGLVRFTFDVSDITIVERKIVKTQFGQNEKIRIFTSQGKKVPVETLMINSGRMIKFISENVSETKMKNIYKAR